MFFIYRQQAARLPGSTYIFIMLGEERGEERRQKAGRLKGIERPHGVRDERRVEDGILMELNGLLNV